MADSFLRATDWLCRLGALAAAVLLFAMFALGLAEIVLRNLAGISLAFVGEYTGYMTASALFLGSGWTLGDGGHIRVSLVADRLSDGDRWALDVAATAIGLLVALFLATALVSYALGTWSLGTRSYFPSATPLAWPQALLAVGPVVLCLALAARLIRLWRREAVS